MTLKPDIKPLLLDLAAEMAKWPVSGRGSMTRYHSVGGRHEDGEHEIRLGSELTAHQSLRAARTARLIDDMVRGIPLVHDMSQIAWTLALTPKPTFTFALEGARPLRIGSSSINVSSVNFHDLHQRMQIVEDMTQEDVDLPLDQFQAIASGRAILPVLARSPRQAALKVAALYVKSYKDVRRWRSIPKEYSLLYRICPRSEWGE